MKLTEAIEGAISAIKGGDSQRAMYILEEIVLPLLDEIKDSLDKTEEAISLMRADYEQLRRKNPDA